MQKHTLIGRFPLDAQSDGAFVVLNKRIVSQRFLRTSVCLFGGYSKGMAFFDMMSDAQVSLQALLRSESFREFTGLFGAGRDVSNGVETIRRWRWKS